MEQNREVEEAPLDNMDIIELHNELQTEQLKIPEAERELKIDVLYVDIDLKPKDYWKGLGDSFIDESTWKLRIQKCAKRIIHAACFRESTLAWVNRGGGALMQFIGYYLSIYHLCVAILSMDYKTEVDIDVTDHNFIAKRMRQSFIKEGGFTGLKTLVKDFKILMLLRNKSNYDLPRYERFSEDLFPSSMLSIFEYCINFFKTLSDYMSIRFSRNQLSFILWEELLQQIQEYIKDVPNENRQQVTNFLVNQNLLGQIQSNPTGEIEKELKFTKVEFDLTQSYIKNLVEMENEIVERKIIDEEEFSVFSKEWKKRINKCAFKLLQAILYRECAQTLYKETHNKILPIIGFYYALYNITFAILSLEKATTLSRLDNLNHSDLIRRVGGIFPFNIENVPYQNDLKTLFEMRNQVIYEFPANIKIEKCYDIIGYIFDFAWDYINKIDRVIYRKYNLLLKEEINVELKKKINTGYVKDYISNIVLVNIITYINTFA
ncbi:MAG: hypothetical protein ACFE9T_16210 [Promethearchaeota archaeon]